MGSADHALQLQFLLRNLHPKRGDADSNSTEVPNPPRDFIRFIYFQCFPKIQQRLYLPVRPGSRAFKDIFSDDGITSDELRLRFDESAAARCPSLDQKILLHGDEWIIPYWKLCRRGKKPEFEQCGDRKYIVHNEAMTVDLHKVIRRMFKLLTAELEKVQCARTPAKSFSAADIKLVKDALDNVDYYMAFLSSLLQSPCFWKYLQQPVLKQWVSNQAGDTMRNPDEVYSFLTCSFGK